MNRHFLVSIFSPSAQVSPVFHIASINRLGFLALLCLSSTLPNPTSVPCDGFTGALGLPALVAGYSSASSPLSRLPTRLYRDFVDSQALSPFHPHLYSRPRSRSRSRPHSPLRAHSRTHPCSRPHPRTFSRQYFLPSVLGALFSPRYHIVGRRRILCPKLPATCRRQLLSTEIVPRAEW